MIDRITKSQHQQAGVFIVELAFIGLLLLTFISFTTDMVQFQAYRGHLERLSYSAVNIIKERTQLYQNNELDDPVTAEQANEVFSIIRSSMRRSMSGFQDDKFAMSLEQAQFDNDGSLLPQVPLTGGNYNCLPDTGHMLKDMTDLHIETSWGKKATLYQVTVCYESDSWFRSVLGESNTAAVARASSIMLGR